MFPKTNLVLRVRETPCKTIVLIFKSQNIDELIKIDNNLFLTCMFNRVKNRTSTEGLLDMHKLPFYKKEKSKAFKMLLNLEVLIGEEMLSNTLQQKQGKIGLERSAS